MLFLASHGFRCIAHDRRAHGRSSQPWDGNEMDTYADDLATLVATLDLKNAVHVGHLTGGGEVARYIGRHGTKRVTKAVLIYAVTAVVALYLNVFVLVVQLFVKVPAVNALAPTQTEPPFVIVQGLVLVLYVVIAIAAAIKFRIDPVR